MKTILLVLLVALAGCTHGRIAPASPPAPVSVSVPKVAPRDAAGDWEEYYVGAISDPEDPAVAYLSGTLRVRARNGNGRTGPQLTSNSADWDPDPTAAEWAALKSKSERALAGLSEENERLVARVQALEKPVAASAAPTPPGEIPVAAPVPSSDPDTGLIVVKPNRDHVIALDPNLLIAPPSSAHNPFVQRYQPPVAWHDLVLTVSAAMPGPSATAVLNDRPLVVGDRLEGLTLHRVEADTVFLRKDAFLLVCPVSENPVTLRLP